MNKLKFPILMFILIITLGFVAPRLQTADAAPLAQDVPPNDNFADAQTITEMPFAASVDISLATAEENEPNWCVEEWANQTVWYTFTPTTNGRLTMMSSGADFRTFSAAFRLDEYGNLVCMGCESGNLSPISLNLQAGVTYYIQTGTWYPNSQGMLSLQVSWQPAPPNDNFADALIVASMPFQGTVNNTAATTETGEPTSGCTPYGSYHTVWYAYTPAENGHMTGDITASFEAFLSVYQANGPSLSDLSEFACAYQDGNFWLDVTQGTTYYFQLGSRYEGSTGDLYLNLNFATPPANDDLANAKIVAAMPYQDTLSTVGATSEPDEPNNCSDWGEGAVRTVWYAYTPSEKGALSGNASGYINSVLAVYTGSAMNNLELVTCTNFDGSFQFTASPGTTYYLQLGGITNWNYGDDQINLSFTPAPPNDDFANAKIVDAMPYQDTVYTLGATSELGEPAACSDWGYGALRTIWYAYTPTENGVLSGNAIAEIYSFLAVYTGNSVDSLSLQTCTNMDNSFQLAVSPGTTYYLQLGSMADWNYGNDTINLSFTPPPANDDFANAKIVNAMPYQDTVDNTGASSEPNEPAGCSYYGPVKTTWYAYTPTEKGVLSGDASVDIYSFLAVYTGSAVDSLTQLTCTNYDGSFQLFVTPGTTYYIQLGSLYEWYYGTDTIRLYFTPAPANDDFANAMVVEGIPFSTALNNTYASTEDGEPDPGCMWGGRQRTLWYAYTPAESGSITFQKGGFYYSFMAVYTGSSLGSLTLQRCIAYWQNIFTLPLETGVTYYIQLGSAYEWEYGDLTLNLYLPPPPSVNIWWDPGDPNRFESVMFCSDSYDPGGEGIIRYNWDFGDGTRLDNGGSCVNHQYLADGDYTVWHKVETTDGRTAETTRVVYVRTHDVAITKFSVPQAVSVGQTRPIVVGIRNTNYPENVMVELYKSTPYGFVWVGALNMEVPVRPANRTTDFKFSYTFANEDGQTGSINFQAVATITNARDAASGNNVAISLPTKVKGYVPGPIPYSATPANPSSVTEAASTFGLLALGLVFGLATVTRKENGS